MVLGVVSGSETDIDYWGEQLQSTISDVFRADGRTRIIPVAETISRGNFFGTLNAWEGVRGALASSQPTQDKVVLISMLFGKGKRLSPFTQALGERKSALPTARPATKSPYNLRTADLSHFCTTGLLAHLEQCGFQGALIKWGDEALVPGRPLQTALDLSRVDAVRFVSHRQLSPDIAREKEWIAYDGQTGLMLRQIARQDIEHIHKRVAAYGLQNMELGVNLGSLAVSHTFLEVASRVLAADIANVRRRLDWDPYVWLALFCANEEEWLAEIEHEARIGSRGISDLLVQFPDFFSKIHALRVALEHETGRPLTVATLDFGEVLWIDYGLHLSLRSSLESLVSDTLTGQATRQLFNIPQVRDARGNTLVRSYVPPTADIRDSVIVDSVILDERSVIHHAVVVGGRHRFLGMPYGGSAIFCAADRLDFLGSRAIALRSTGREFSLSEGDRHTCLFVHGSVIPMISNEAITDYSGRNYSEPILGNSISFAEAGEIMSQINGHSIEAEWGHRWSTWLAR
jgi:hypothetical protein